jgi:hypothetical protein
MSAPLGDSVKMACNPLRYQCERTELARESLFADQGIYTSIVEGHMTAYEIF